MLRFRTPLQRILQKSYPTTWVRQQYLKSSSSDATSTHGQHSTSREVDTGREQTDEGVQATTDTSGKLKTRLPLVKNFFVGVVDKELLAFPEVVPRENMADLQQQLVPLRNFFAADVDARTIDATRTLPSTVLDGVRQLDLYGLNVSKNYGGKGWGWSESLIAAEPETSSTDVALSLLSHRVVIDLLQEQGTPEQQQRFLSKLSCGSLVATEAVYEYDAPEEGYFNTSAEYRVEDKKWALNGKKSYVICGPLPTGATQLFLVIAETYRLNMSRDGARGTTLFLVDSTTPGVKLGEQHMTIGCRGLQMRHVHFDQVLVPEDCVVGEPHLGNEAADGLLRASRLRNALIGLGMSKNVLNGLSEYCASTKQCGVALKDMDMMQAHLSQATCAIYAMESMIYHSAGLLDEFDKQNVTLEAAIAKYYTLTRLFKLSSKCMEIIGPRALHAGEPSEVVFRNATQLCTHGESIDSMRMFIALTGLQHAGSLLNDSVRKSRNPLFHPKHVFGKFMQTSTIDNPKSNLRLGEHLHPTLEPAAQCIEHAVVRLQLCVDMLLTRHGAGVMEQHGEMQRLAEMAATVYAMFASASRASRSYCIGLQLADHELLTATSICSHGGDVVRTLASEIFNGPYVNNDNNLRRLSGQVLKSKGYFAVHPLTYNY